MHANERFFPPGEPDDRSSHAHRQLIGALGLVLAPLLWLVAAWRPTPGLEAWRPLRSVSTYYHTGAVAVFVGVLAALAVFLFTYRGYANVWGRRDRVAAIVAGTAAVLVAFFPTKAPAGVSAPSWWAPWMGTAHYVGAAVLFAAFIFFALLLFPKSGVEGTLPRDKRVRNGVYRACGGVMTACIAWATAAAIADRPIFWPETLALEFFAASWLVKGRADRTAVAVLRRAGEAMRPRGQEPSRRAR